VLIGIGLALILPAESAEVLTTSSPPDVIATLYGFSPVAAVVLAIGIVRAARTGRNKQPD